MSKRRMQVRCEFFEGTDSPVFELDDEDESILNVEHQGAQWWVYIVKWAEDEVGEGGGE
jgi:hypothetical protein